MADWNAWNVSRDAASKKDLAELSLLMLAAMEQGEREMVPSVEAVALETAKRLPSETDKLLAAVQSGDERRATVPLARHDTTRHDTTRHDTTRHDTTRHDTTRTTAHAHTHKILCV